MDHTVEVQIKSLNIDHGVWLDVEYLEYSCFQYTGHAVFQGPFADQSHC